MTLKAARDSSSSSDTPKAMPDFLGSRQWIRSFTAKSREAPVRFEGRCEEGEERHQMEKNRTRFCESLENIFHHEHCSCRTDPWLL